MAKGVINLSLAVDDTPEALLAALVTRPADNQRTPLTALGKVLAACAGGVRRSKYTLRVDSCTEGSTQGVLEAANPTITITFANITAGETVSIGGATFTWAVAAANQNEATIGANLAAATGNLAGAINVHTDLLGIVSASGNTATGVITLTFHGDPRMAKHMLLSETGDAVAVSATSFAADSTNSNTGGITLVDLGMG